MIKVQVTFTKETTITVVGESREEIEAATKAAAESDEIDRDWNLGDWDYKVAQPAEHRQAELKCHMGVVDGELVHIDDYNRAKGTEVPEAED